MFAAPELPPLVLASGSPRRRELLSAIGLTFEVRPAEIDETPGMREEAAALVARLAESKARHVASVRPGALVLAADTVVACDGEIFGKPADDGENLRFLERLSGRGHEVYTGHCLTWNGATASRVRRTEVTIRALSAGEMSRYVASGEGRDKAGGYGIQGRGAHLVPHIDGCYFTVVGLSPATVIELAGELGVTLV